MIRYWTTLTPAIKAEVLVDNLVRRFKMAKGTAWIIITRLRNEAHTEAQRG
jgi:hypothetical protein